MSDFTYFILAMIFDHWWKIALVLLAGLLVTLTL